MLLACPNPRFWPLSGGGENLGFEHCGENGAHDYDIHAALRPELRVERRVRASSCSGGEYSPDGRWIAVVSQDSTLLTGTVAENIAFGRGDDRADYESLLGRN